ncbi:MAG TPA: ATP-binding protein, partial [Ktedonobacterales bacterium]|nr:ATP-binding protein [Ktedonobacterales bacterium]
IGVVVIDREYDVQTINGAAYRLLDINRVAIDRDLLHLAERVPTAPLRAAIDAAFEGMSAADDKTTTVVETTQTERRTLQIACYPYVSETRADTAQHASETVESVILLISDVTEREQRRATGTTQARARSGRSSGKRGATPDAGHRSAENERSALRLDEAHALIRELRAANQELKTRNLDVLRANEDLLISQEEAQAASEEVKTLYEEMQASNEELETLNEEMEATVEELHTTNDDLQARSKELQRLAEDREEQRQTSERERASLAAILLSMADALLVVDAGGRTMLTNDAYRQLFGNLDDASVLDLQDSDGHPLPAEATPRQRASAGTPFRMDFTMPASNGERRWFEARGEPIRSDDTLRGGVVSIRDITDHSLRRMQEQFLAMVSHELRSPLTAAHAAFQLLERQFPAGQDEKARSLAGIAIRQMRQLRLLVDDLADLGRIQQGEFQFTFQPIAVVALMEQLIESMSLVAVTGQERRHIMLMVDPASESMRIAGDPVRVEQIFTNLLTNAMKYAQWSKQIDVHLQQVDDMVEIAVRDYGPGIPAAELPHLFSRFYQVMSTRSQAQGGVGLGLFITQALVKAHGGSIGVRSTEGTEGSGTTFTVRFPLLQTASVVVEPEGRHSSHETSDGSD